jgi:hypothetical protein
VGGGGNRRHRERCGRCFGKLCSHHAADRDTERSPLEPRAQELLGLREIIGDGALGDPETLADLAGREPEQEPELDDVLEACRQRFYGEAHGFDVDAPAAARGDEVLGRAPLALSTPLRRALHALGQREDAKRQVATRRANAAAFGGTQEETEEDLL